MDFSREKKNCLKSYISESYCTLLHEFIFCATIDTVGFIIQSS